MRMLLFLITLALLAVSVVAPAQARRPDSRTYTCAGLQALIDQRGAAVITTGTYTFERYVAHRGFCQRSEVTARKTAPTKDTKRCPVLVCREPVRFRD